MTGTSMPTPVQHHYLAGGPLGQEECSMNESFERLKAILDRMPVACMLHDEQLRYTYWNSSAEKTFEYSFAETKGKHPFDVIALPAGEPSGAESGPAARARMQGVDIPLRAPARRGEASPG